MTEPRVAPPPSATPPLVALAGALAFTVGTVAVLLAHWNPERRLLAGGIILGATALALVLTDVLAFAPHRRPSTGLDFSRRSPSLARTLVKTLGLAGTLAVVAVGYWLLPEYGGPFYADYFQALRLLVWPTALLAPLYIHLVDRHQTQPLDGTYQAGLVCCGRWSAVDPSVLRQHALGWLIKAFFLPLMFTYFINDTSRLLLANRPPPTGFAEFYDLAYDALYFADVGLVSLGYVLSLRVIDTHLRSAESTVGGWVAALVCYEPFWSVIGDRYLAYGRGPTWGVWLHGRPLAYTLWGTTILWLTGIYVWATFSFGARFSNLTHRGIITSGPYRYVKHPAYLAKNLSWWMISVPFLLQDSPGTALQRSAMLLGVNLIYVTRALTEERHLSQDPRYRDYSAFLDRHGWLRLRGRSL